jgi:hypothetical protein
MTLELLLILATVEATGRAQVGRPTTVGVSSSSARAEANRGASPGLTWRGTSEAQLTNRRTGVTCTMRIVAVESPMDRGVMRMMPPSPDHPDPMVRSTLSPCVE